MSIILYGLPESIYTRIIRIILEEKNIEYQFAEVDVFCPEHIPDWFKNMSPFGRIPVLKHDDLELYESAAIGRYLDRQFKETSLQPLDVKMCFLMDQTISIMDAYAYKSMILDLFVPSINNEKIAISNSTGRHSNHEIFFTILERLENILKEHHYLAGAEFTLADSFSYPIILYFNVTSYGSLMVQNYPQLQEWLSRISKRKSVVKTSSKYG